MTLCAMLCIEPYPLSLWRQFEMKQYCSKSKRQLTRVTQYAGLYGFLAGRAFWNWGRIRKVDFFSFPVLEIFDPSN